MPETKVAVVTGATSGIGRWIALGLARAGLRTLMVVRDAARGRAASAWIAERVPRAITEVIEADLSLLGQTRATAAHIAERHPQIAVLVNNAGIFSERRRVTSEGRELVLAVNHLAPFVLTRGLAGALHNGAPARVVNVGSAASDRAPIQLDDLEGLGRWSGLHAYGQSKLALMMATFAWAERLEAAGVAANVVHPGLVATKIGKVPGLIGVLWRLLMPFAISPERGADTPLHVALAPELDGLTGRYFKNRREAQPNPLACDKALVSRLWAETERLCAV